MKRRLLWYSGIYIALSFLLLKTLYNQISESFIDLDLLWFIPSLIRQTEGMHLMDMFKYCLNPLPIWFAVPWLKVYSLLVMSLFGPFAKYLITSSILIHFLCSILVLFLSRQLGLNRRVSFFSSLIYLTFFAHFHAYFWPMAFQHLCAVFFILLVLNLYLKSDSIISSNGNYYKYYLLALVANLFATFCRASIFSLPAMIMAHILLCSKDNKDRIRKYDIWLPLFLSYLFYPLIVFSYGDPRLFMYFNNLAIPAFLKFLILFVPGALLVFLFRGIIGLFGRSESFRLKCKVAAIILFVAAAIVLLKTGGPRRLLIPYNIIVPFAGVLASFLHPLKNALVIESTRPYHFIPLQLGVFNILLSIFILVIFVREFIFKHRALAILAVWYLLDLGYLYLRNPLLSRYFIYITPLFCIIFCSVADYLYVYFMNSTRLKARNKEIVFVSIFISLCIPNLLAIKLSLLKSRMVNTFLTYDYIRAANIIKEDLIRNYSLKDMGIKSVYINNVLPITFGEDTEFAASDPKNDNARLIFMQVLDYPFINIKLNSVIESNSHSPVYFLNADRIDNIEGSNLSIFSRLVEEAQEQLKSSHHMEAVDMFKMALAERPFLFRFILSKLKLEDLEWITDGRDMRSWLNRIFGFYSSICNDEGLKRVRHISAIMNKEIDDYIKCLFYMSYLKQLSGSSHESKYWFASIKYLDRDYNRLFSWFSMDPLVKSDSKILSFLNNLDGYLLYEDAFDTYADRYKFERFLFNLLRKT